MSVQCPNCNSGYSRITNTLNKKYSFRGRSKNIVYRYRRCMHCGTAWPTVERNEEDIQKDEDPPVTPESDPLSTGDNPFI